MGGTTKEGRKEKVDHMQGIFLQKPDFGVNDLSKWIETQEIVTEKQKIWSAQLWSRSISIVWYERAKRGETKDTRGETE